MTANEITRRFPKASASFIAANLDRAGAVAVVERPARPQSLEANRSEEAAASRLHIRFVSVRKRLCDPDNLSEKWLLDCLRNCGAIIGDEPDKITLETGQRKCAKDEAEHTVIEIYKP